MLAMQAFTPLRSITIDRYVKYSLNGLRLPDACRRQHCPAVEASARIDVSQGFIAPHGGKGDSRAACIGIRFANQTMMVREAVRLPAAGTRLMLRGTRDNPSSTRMRDLHVCLRRIVSLEPDEGTRAFRRSVQAPSALECDCFVFNE